MRESESEIIFLYVILISAGKWKGRERKRGADDRKRKVIVETKCTFI